MRRAFAVPGFGRLYVGTTASMVGDSLMLIVMSMWVKTLTGSNGAAGLTFMFLTLPAGGGFSVAVLFFAAAAASAVLAVGNLVSNRWGV